MYVATRAAVAWYMRMCCAQHLLVLQVHIYLKLLLAPHHSTAAVHMLDHTTASTAEPHLKDL
jgi:hypothetical protein